MKRGAQLECSFFIPLCRDSVLSDGKRHGKAAWHWLNAKLCELFQARTIAPGLYSGLYQDPDTGQPVEDESRRYLVAVPSSPLDMLRDLLAEACLRFQQKCIYLSVAGSVEFIRPRT